MDRRAFLAMVGGTTLVVPFAQRLKELGWIEGELHLARGNPAEAEARFRAAIKVARERSEKSLELRATTSLAGLLAMRGQRDEAGRELAAVLVDSRLGRGPQ